MHERTVLVHECRGKVLMSTCRALLVKVIAAFTSLRDAPGFANRLATIQMASNVAARVTETHISRAFPFRLMIYRRLGLSANEHESATRSLVSIKVFIWPTACSTFFASNASPSVVAL